MAVDLVTTDVIVRDQNGQFVADMNKDDFQILEDGVRQDVASLVLVHGGRVLNQILPPPPAPQEGIILPPTRPTNDAAGRIFLFFVDDLHLDFRDTARIRQLFTKIRKILSTTATCSAWSRPGRPPLRSTSPTIRSGSTKPSTRFREAP